MHRDQEVLQASRVSTVLRVCHDNPSTGGHLDVIRLIIKFLQDITGKVCNI